MLEMRQGQFPKRQRRGTVNVALTTMERNLASAKDVGERNGVRFLMMEAMPCLLQKGSEIAVGVDAAVVQVQIHVKVGAGKASAYISLHMEIQDL